MEKEGFDFVATGEVKGQRPMSQKPQDLINAIKESGLEGRLLRPLSAKLLPITIPEKEGLINRENLFGIYGRARHTQMELAKEFGIKDYPIPAGSGCSIVDKSYAKRYNELISYNTTKIINMEIMQYLAIGKHIRIDENAKLILGRNEKENNALEKRDRIKIKRIDDITLKPNYNKGPFGYLEIYKDNLNNLKDIIYKSAMIMGYFSKENFEYLSITISYIENGEDKKEIIKINNADSKNTKFEQIV